MITVCNCKIVRQKYARQHFGWLQASLNSRWSKNMNERSFSDLEGKYTMCNWTYKRKREAWRLFCPSRFLLFVLFGIGTKSAKKKRLINYFCPGCVVEARKAQASSLFSPALTPTGFSFVCLFFVLHRHLQVFHDMWQHLPRNSWSIDVMTLEVLIYETACLWVVHFSNTFDNS